MQCLDCLLGYGTELRLTAANGTQIPYISWAVVEFDLKSKRESRPPLEVPMIVTKENLDQPIIGFNIIKLYCESPKPEALVEKEVLSDIFAASFQNVKVNKLDT